jgi:RNA recognition motif-containing protein
MVRYVRMRTYLDFVVLRVIFMSVYIGNLSYTVTSDELTLVFSQYGVVRRVQLPMDRETGQARGFAFIEMETDEQEDKAIEELNEAEFMGRELRASKAKPKEATTPVMAAGTRPVKSADRSTPAGERPARTWVDRSNGWSDRGGTDSFQRR